MLCPDASGQRKAFVCRYHGWAYELSGRLMNVPLRPTFPLLRDEEYGLNELPLALQHGFVVVTPSPQDALRSKVLFDDVEESHLAIGFHGPSLLDARMPAVDVLAVLLGQGESSRLVARVNEPVTYGAGKTAALRAGVARAAGADGPADTDGGVPRVGVYAAVAWAGRAEIEERRPELPDAGGDCGVGE